VTAAASIKDVGTAVATTGAIAAAAYLLPGATAIAPLRLALLPGLAGVGAADHVALTFDDGPDPASTPQILDVLAEHGVRATFFILGFMAERAPALVRDMVAAGHELAVHGFEHRMLVGRSPRATLRDIARARDLLIAVTGCTPRYYRPPYGVLTAGALHAAEELSLQPVLWTTCGKDWTAHATAESVHHRVIRGPLAAGTILLHDADCTAAPGAWRSTLGALPKILWHCQGQGLRVGRLDEHFPRG
jgi:peptidoglycan/xylan/chitin deacetylase (PgdA/CDA1 family)